MKLGLVIDLDTCVGCHACATACKEWNGASAIAGPLTDSDPYGADPSGTWLNRVRHYEVGTFPESKTINMPMSCLHCEDAACVTVCPTGASYKRADGIVLVDESRCMGCNLCAWACPYGARELDASSGTRKKCTLCVNRVHDEHWNPAQARLGEGIAQSAGRRMPPINGHGYRAPVVVAYRQDARHRNHGTPRHAGDRARRMPERHTPNESRMIMTKHRELGLFRQPRQQRLGAVHFDQLI